MRLLLSALAFCCVFGQDKPGNIRVSTWVREDLFAGFLDNDAVRFAEGVRKLKALQAQDPNDPETLAWMAGAHLYMAVQAHEAGDRQKFQREYAQADELYAKSASLSQGTPKRPGVLAITGGSFVVFADRLPLELRRQGWERARANYTALREAQMPAFDKYPLHMRGEVMAGLAQAAQRLGESENARTLTEEVVAAFPGTPYAVFAKRWLDNPDTIAKSKIACLTCHEPGRLQAVLTRK